MCIRDSALKAVTINAAWQLFEDDRRGSITVGKAADFVLLSQNPLRVNPENIKITPGSKVNGVSKIIVLTLNLNDDFIL